MIIGLLLYTILNASQVQQMPDQVVVQQRVSGAGLGVGAQAQLQRKGRREKGESWEEREERGGF